MTASFMYNKICRLWLCLTVSIILTACGGGSDSNTSPSILEATISVIGTTPPPTVPADPVEPVSITPRIETEAAAVRFLTFATFGATKTDIAALQSENIEDWLTAEFAKPASLTFDLIAAGQNGETPSAVFNYASHQYWDQMISSDDQLRQRMAYALSQILVYSDIQRVLFQRRRAYYQDILINNAFGNYRDLLQDVTYSPAMGNWLTYENNKKGDPVTGRMPDENYAREILQLFSIGVTDLNLDGTLRLDSTGNEVESYTSEDIIGLSRVFTGLRVDNSNNTNDTSLPLNQQETIGIGHDMPMIMNEADHSTLEKAFLGTIIPENTPGEQSISLALDAIFNHANVPPFIARQLIQRFTASDPTPAYVERVAIAFRDGLFVTPSGRQFGTGERGDLEATLAAILMDEDLHDEAVQDVSSGKIKEPVLKVTNYARALVDPSTIDSHNVILFRSTSTSDEGLGQHPFRSPSVFNFYRPGFIAPGTESGNSGVTAPELQILDATSALGQNNVLSDFAFNDFRIFDASIPTYIPDYSEEIILADDVPALVDHLDILLTGQRLSSEERDVFVSILEGMDIRLDTNNETADRTSIVRLATYLFLTSPTFSVTW